MRGTIKWFFPPPRRPVTVGSAMPLIVFLVAFLGVSFALERLDVVLFAAPGMFALSIAAVWFWWMSMGGYAGLSRGRATAALLLRLLLLGAFIFMLAQPRTVRKHDTLSIVFALDMSASIGPDAREQALELITRIAGEKPQEDEIGLIVFGRDAAVELPPEISFPLDDQSGVAITLQVNRDGTNIAKVLSLAGAMIPDEHQGRVVLISDGSETEGALATALNELHARGIAVDVLPIDYRYDNEVWIERLELPRVRRLGETYEAAVILSSLNAGAGTLVLEQNGRRVFEGEVEYRAGKNRFVIPIAPGDPGYYEYEAKIEIPAALDGVQQNNHAISYLHIRGEGKVLIVTDPGGDPRDYQLFVRALEQSQRDVEVIEAYNLPGDPLQLLPYDAVVFVNVAADQFAVDQFAAVHDAVYNQASGFLMVGGENSFGPGGYHRTQVEEILPVSMDVTQRKVLPKAALVITLHTCEFADGNTWAKRITKQAIKVLTAQDEVGVLAYDYQGGDSWIFPLTPAGQYESMARKINSAQIGDMPTFVRTMTMALAALKASDASARHMIIISDGDPQPPSPQLLEQFVANRISVSTVAVFPHGGNQTQTMEMIAQATGGRFYFPQDPAVLPSIFIREAKTLQRSMIQNDPFQPQVEFSSDIIKGITSMPQLYGFVLTTAKPRSITVLKGPKTEELDPVLSVWNFGVGKTAAFTSDLSPNWGRDWVSWDHYRAFVEQLLTEISRVNKPSDLYLQTFADGNQGRVIITDESESLRFLDVQTLVSGPRDRTQTLRLKQTGPRRYEAEFDLWGEGRYQVMALAGAGDESRRVHGGFVVAYSNEYLRFRANPIVLEQIETRTDGRLLAPDVTGEKLYDVERETKQSSSPIFDWLLFALAIAVPLDVGLRRIHIDWLVIKGWFGFGRAAPSEQTFSTLLRRKQQVGDALKTRDDAPPPIPMRPADHGPDLPPIQPDNTPKPAATKPAQRDEEPESTTGRLLDLKRKRQQEQDNQEQ
jgi:uncharacterized membrane protein